MADRTDFLRTREARVASIELGSNETLPWHCHTELLERIVCLSGRIEVHSQNPDSVDILQPGEMAEVQAHRVHRLVNSLSLPSACLLVQSGAYDFIPIDA